MLASSKNRSDIGEPPGREGTTKTGLRSTPDLGGRRAVAAGVVRGGFFRRSQSGGRCRGVLKDGAGGPPAVPDYGADGRPQVPDQGTGVSVGVLLGVSVGDSSAAGLPVALGVEVGVRSM